jgi:biopolymer transport protein ExbB
MNSLPLTLIVQSALWALGFFSIATWTIIVAKAVQYARAARADRRTVAELANIHALGDIAARTLAEGPASRVTHAALDAMAAARLWNGDSAEALWSRQDTLERELTRQISHERRRLEHSIAWLASVGSVAPFVGLFGTVFGIIHALGAISHAASASIDVVAGPIGEALVATGVGIAVAVPAVLAYNVFVRRVKVVVARLDDQAADLYALAQRQQFKLTPALADQPATAARPTFARATEVTA